MKRPLYQAAWLPQQLQSNPLTRYNSPGQATLSYRVGRYPDFVNDMVQQAHGWTERRSGERPLSKLNLDMPGEFGAAMIKAWAVVGDVLSFYQERIANEGYLATCTEAFSAYALAAQIGYRPAPALSATTHLSYTLRDAPGAPPLVALPAGPQLTVQSVPVDGQLPQTFENDEQIDARVEWNALRLWRGAAAATPSLRPGATMLLLDGERTTPRPGSRILMLGHVAGARAWALAECGQLAPNRGAGSSLLHFTRLACSANAAAAVIADLTMVALDQGAALFGSHAAPWSGLPANIRQRHGTRGGGTRVSDDGGAGWRPNGDGLPDTAVRTLLVTPEGALLAGGLGGLWRCAGPGLGWSAVRTLGKRGFHDLRLDRQGNLFAACDNGVLLRSNDAGDSWLQLDVVLQSPARPTLRRALLPAAMQGTMRALAFDPRADGAGLLAAGDSGVFYNPGGAAWQSGGAGLPGYDADSGLCSEPVLCLWSDPRTLRIWAGTQQGPFCCDKPGGPWRAARGGMPLRQHVHAIAGAGNGGQQALFAATDGGLWRSGDDGASWQLLVLDADAAGAPEPAVLALLVQAGAALRLLAGTAIGLFASDDLGSSWRRADATLLMECDARVGDALDAGRIDPGLRQALAEHGVALGADAAVTVQAAGQRWRIAAAGAATPLLSMVRAGAAIRVFEENPAARAPVTALAGNGALLAMAVPFGDVVEQEWPGFHPAGGHIDLDRVYPGLVRGSWLALCQPGAALPYALGQVRSEERLQRSDFGLTASVSRLTLDWLAPASPSDANLDPLRAFSLRDCSVALQGAVIPLFRSPRARFAAVAGATFDIDALAPPFRAAHKISLAGTAASARLAVPLGGVSWADSDPAFPAALAGQDVRVLQADSAGALHAGGAEGVFKLVDGAWSLLATLAGVRTVHFDAAGALHAGTADGLFCWSGSTWQDAGLAGHAVCALGADAAGTMLAAVDSAGAAGVYRNTGTSQWQRLDGGLDDSVPTALACHDGSVYLGTAGGGVFHLPRDALRWAPLSAGLASWQINTLACDRAGGIWAGTRGAGLYCLQQGRWRHRASTFAHADVRAFHHGADGRLYAAAWGDGIYSSAAIYSPADHGAITWNFRSALAGNAVCALGAGADGRVLAGAAAVCVLARDDGSQFELAQARIGTLPAALAPALAQDFVTPDIGQALAALGIRLSAAATLQMDAGGAAWLADGIDRQWLLLPQHDGVRIYDNPRLHVLGAPAAGAPRWMLGDRHGNVGALSCHRSQLLLQAAGDDNPALGEIATIDAVIPGPDTGASRLVLAQALANAYDPQGLVICANVARASHGETVSQEVLGSGNAARGNQQFQLKKAPLTVLASADGAPAGILQVHARARGRRAHHRSALPGTGELGILWQQVSALAGAGPRSRVYTAVTDQYGRATLTFGDGRHGARLPSANENVFASYRAGAGVAGNVDAGQLNRLRSRPAGVNKVVNAVPARGGTAAETVRQIQRSAPRSISALGRVVSLGDYAVYARHAGGVAKSAVREIWTGKRRIVQLTLAGPDGAALDAARLATLRDAIDADRAIAQPLHLSNYEARLFQLCARVRIAPHNDADVVLPMVRAALLAAFGFDARQLGEAVSASEVIACIQQVPGVLALTVTNFQLLDASHGVYQVLPALPARWDRVHARIRGAQLLTLAPAALTLIAETGDE